MFESLMKGFRKGVASGTKEFFAPVTFIAWYAKEWFKSSKK